MRRLPIYILLDVSGSMRGEPIEQVKYGLDLLMRSLQNDPYAVETVWLSVITFALDAQLLFPLAEINGLKIPPLPDPVTSPTNLGEALGLLMDRYALEVRPSTPEQKGDWRPILVLMTDGAPSDVELYRQNVERLKRDFPFARIVCCAAGPKAKVEPLRSLADEISALDTMDASSFSKFWSWVSTSVSCAVQNRVANSQNVEIEDEDDELPPPPPEIRIL